MAKTKIDKEKSVFTSSPKHTPVNLGFLTLEYTNNTKRRYGDKQIINDEFEELNKAELLGALESYAQDRARGWALVDDIGPVIDPKIKYSDLPSSPSEQSVQRELLSIQDNYNLLETVDTNSINNNFEKPVMTICVPMAILYEDASRIMALIESIKSSLGEVGGPVEIILWTNAKFTNDNEANIKEKCEQEYKSLKNKLMDYSSNGLQVKTALQIMPEDDFSMSRLRKNFMEALVGEAANRGYGFNHTVMWLDADVTNIKKGTLGAIKEEVESFNSLFCHPSIYYSIDWQDGKPAKDWDNATRAFSIDEMARRMELRPRRYFTNEYTEESGFSFALGTYLRVGGVNEANPINETFGLLSNARHKRTSGGVECIIPEIFLENRSNNFTKDLRYVSNGRIYLSARRQYEELKRLGRTGSRGDSLLGGDGTGYTLYSDVRDTVETQADINLEYLKKRLRRLSSKNARVAKMILDKYFPQDK